MVSATETRVLAVCVLGATGLGMLLFALVGLRRLPFTPAQKFLYIWNYLTARILWRTEIDRPLPIPPDQGAVIICNHRCPFDPSFVALTAMRVVHWMVAKEYCENRLFSWLLRVCEVIPVTRAGIDTAATKLAIRYVQQGGLVGLFPEGRLNTSDQLMLPGRPGVAMIALKARAPVVPCFIHGAPYNGTTLGALFMPAKVHLKIGQPMDLSSYYDREGQREVLDDLTRRFLVEIAKLGGRPDFQPQLAGRFYKPGLADA